MALIEKLFGWIFGTPGAETWETARNWRLNLDLPSGEDSGLDKPYIQHPVIASACEVIADDAAAVPWELWPAGTDHEGEPIEDHPLLSLLARPNDLLRGNDLWRLSYLHLLLFGEFFWLLEAPPPRAGATPAAQSLQGRLTVLYPPAVAHKINDDGSITWGLRQSTGEVRELDGERLIHHRRINPYDPVRGVSKLTPLLADLSGDKNAAEWNRRFFGDQNGLPGGLIEPGAAMLTPEQKRDILEAWNARHGRGRRGIGILPGPGWKFHDLSVTQKDMDFRGLREYARELALSVLGVPPFLAGVLDKANYANARKQEEVYWRGTIKRMLSHVQETMNVRLMEVLGYRGQLELWPKYEVIEGLLEDTGQKYEMAQKLHVLGVPLTVINDRLDLGLPVDEIEGADLAMVPSTMVPLGLVTAPPQQEQQDGAEKRVQVAGKGEMEREAHRAMVWRSLVDRTRYLSYEFERVVRAHFRRLYREALENLDDVKGWRLLHDMKARTMGGAAYGLIDLAKANARLKKVTAPKYKAALKKGAESLALEVGIDISFDLDSPKVHGYIGLLTDKVVGINETVAAQLEKALKEAFEDNRIAPDELRNVVRSVFDASLGRARTIARTEVGAAYNLARNDQMHAAGVARKEWLTARDPDVREWHESLDGEVVPIDQPFSNGLQHPNDPGGPPEEVINCRCVALPVLED